MQGSRSIAGGPARRRLTEMFRLATAMVFIAGLIAVAAGSPRTARAADNGRVTSVTTKVLGQFDAAALLPAGPLTAVATITKYPAGYAQKHHHGGLKLLYVLSGTMEITDDAGTVVHHTGDFWVEAAGHSHTAHAVTDATIFSIDLLPPGAQATVPEAPATGPTNVERTALGTIDATGLFPTGPLTGSASLVTFPTGYMQKHYHGGPRFVYQLSGTIQLDDAAGREVHQAGIFFVEPRGHVHTAHVLTQATNLVFDFLTPGTKSTYPLVAALPVVTPSGPGMSASFTTTFSSAHPGNGMILFGSGPGCSGLVETAMSDSGSGTVSHSLTVRGNDMPGTVGDDGIVPGATYWFETVAVTRAGIEVDNNDGQCYSVTVPVA